MPTAGLRSSFPRLLTIIAPRHPDRGAGILEIANSRGTDGANFARAANCRGPMTDIYIADTMGELGLIYRLARSFSSVARSPTHGGQNPIEPVKLGAAVLHGPHVWNFAEIYAALDEAHGAEQVTDVASSPYAWVRCCRTWMREQRLVAAGRGKRSDQLGGASTAPCPALDRTLIQAAWSAVLDA